MLHTIWQHLFRVVSCAGFALLGVIATVPSVVARAEDDGPPATVVEGESTTTVSIGTHGGSLVVVPSVIAPVSEVPAQPLWDGSACDGVGCTHLNATRNGDQITVKAHGFSYTPGTKVWVQINIEDSLTGNLLYRDYDKYTVKADERTPVKIAFADCGTWVLVQAWTWVAGSNDQPTRSVRL